jgi:hypothetical protein
LTFDGLTAGELTGVNEYGIASELAYWFLLGLSFAFVGKADTSEKLKRIFADYSVIASLAWLAKFVLLASVLAAAVTGADPDSLYAQWLYLSAVIWMWLLASIGWAGMHLAEPRPRHAFVRFVMAALAAAYLLPAEPIFYGPKTSWERQDVWVWARNALSSPKTDSAADGAEPPQKFITPARLEAALYDQPNLLEYQLQKLQRSAGLHPQMYFIGLAPTSVHDVFEKEVNGARAVFDDRFGTTGRSMVMINSHLTLDTIPLATATNLERALHGVAGKMDRERDILVLFITTHGAIGQLQVSLPGISLSQITPDGLAAALDDARIKNRVLIISACHSGSFVPELASPDTLIMTAAHTEKTSFGCANGRDWTYFGDALFAHALKETRSLTEAFHKAAALIKSWEKEQGIAASEPQISAGANITKLLDSLTGQAEISSAN